MWILGLCVAAVAATACSAWDTDKEYHYKTDIKMLHELDKQVHQHAGYIGRSNLILQFKENALLARVEHPEMYLLNERPDPDHPQKHDFHLFPEAVEHMAKPFRINLEHEAVTSIQVAKDDPLWSVNAKKAIAARLQMQNLNTKNESEKHFYIRSEDGASGECEVAYEIDLEDEEHEIALTKTKNFDKCKSLTYRYYDNQNLQNCFHHGGNSVHRPLQMSETTHIDLKGSRENHHITALRMEESFMYAPYGVDADYIKGIAKLKMVLTGIVPVTEEMKIADDAVTHHDLHYRYQNANAEIKDAEDLKAHPYGFYYFLGQKHSVEKVAELFESLMTVDDGKNYTEVFKEKSMPFFFMTLHYAMTSLNYDQLKDLYENHVKKEGQPGETMEVRKQIFKQALVASGTSSAFMLLKEKMESGKIPSIFLHQLFMQIPMSLQPISEPLLEEFYSLCKSPHIHDDEANRKICLLAFTTVVHEQCVSRYHKIQEILTPTEKIHCTPEIAEKFFQKFLAEPETHADDSYSRILFIKLAGNFGTRGSMKELMKIVHDDTMHPYFKFNAIMALEHHLNNYWDEVQHAMLPVYYSARETQEVRIAALLTILYSEPDLQHLEGIAEDLALQHNNQVVHLAMSAFEQFAQMESPCMAETAEKCKRVLRYLKRVGYKTTDDFRHSFTQISDGFNHKFQIGGGSTFNYVTSNHSYVPQSFYVYLEDYVGRTVKSPLYFGYSGYGFDKVIDNFFGFRKYKDAQTPSVEKELKEFDEKLHLEVRKPEPMLGEFFVNSFGSTLNFFHFNETSFAEFAKKTSAQLPGMLEPSKDNSKTASKRFYMGRQKKFTMPSALGWPYGINTEELHFVHLRNNQFKLNIDPNLLTGAKTDGPPPTIDAKIDAHLVLDRYSYASMGTPLPTFHVSASAAVLEREYSSLPLKLKISLDPVTPKVMIKYTPILPHTRMLKSFTPITMIHNMSSTDFKKGMLPYHHKKNELVKVEEDMFHDYLGYGIHFKGNFSPDRKLDSIGSLRKFIMENDLRTNLYYLQHNPLAVAYDYEISVTPASKDQTNEIDIEFSGDHWGFDTHSDKSHAPPFPAVKDGHEEYINSQEDRKARTCVAKVDVVAKGTKERKLHIGLGYTHTFDDKYHQLNFNYDRSPFGPKETEHFKICSSASVLYPHVDMQKMYHLATGNMDPNINVSVDIHFGKNCENDRKITVRAEMERTDEHKKQQAEVDSPDAASDNLDAKLYRECKKNIENGHVYSFSCRKYWYRALKVREYKSDVELINFSDDDKLKADEVIEHLDSYLKHHLYYYLGDSDFKFEHDANKYVMLFDANFSATTDHVDIRFVKPDKKVLEFHHVPHPHDIQARSATPFFEFTNKMIRWSYYKFPFCAVEGNKVHSFDNVHFDIPPMDCYKVLAKDCSQKNLFTILDKKVTNDRFHKAIKVFLGNWLIEALPISADSDIVVRVNGHRVAVSEAKTYYHYEKHDDKDHLMFTVSYDGLFYKIRSQKYGVIVYYDGNAVVVNLSPYYRGKQCGLCGDFNNIRDHEFVGANNCHYKNATDFSYSYAIPGDGCQVPDITAHCEHHEH